MEVKIGVQYAAREIGFESKSTPDKVAAEVAAALAAGEVLSLVDDKGRRYLVPADKITYVEIGEASSRRVGFGAS
ncbi:MAG: hypothetical protein QG671_4409 [Actinomycetota bacterium]|nr:hypothetical protein [Actinomycetota bacterium]HQZ85255.1 DUF3107 domain-containing protein [Actinomycetota bacterium]